jgi:hypothetical protein
MTDMPLPVAAVAAGTFTNAPTMYTYNVAVYNAELTRQVAYAAAQVAYGWVQANFAVYKAAILAADKAFLAAVDAAGSVVAAYPPNPVFPGSSQVTLLPQNTALSTNDL